MLFCSSVAPLFVHPCQHQPQYTVNQQLPAAWCQHGLCIEGIRTTLKRSK